MIADDQQMTTNTAGMFANNRKMISDYRGNGRDVEELAPGGKNPSPGKR
jgi:hypothetical protein